MKKTLHILLTVLLLAGLTMTAQIQRGKKQTTPKTEQMKKQSTRKAEQTKKTSTQSNLSKPNRGNNSRSSTNGAQNMTKAERERKQREYDEQQRKAQKEYEAELKAAMQRMELERKAQEKGEQERARKSRETGESEMLQSQRDRVLRELEDNMVWVEGGTFTMGATSEQGNDAKSDEKPSHQVTLSGFYICKYEVTQELWYAVMGSNPSYYSGGLNYPVENVSWEDCQAFISKLNSLAASHYRFPTEAEWEYAARGGSRSNGYKYAGGNDLASVAWYGDNSGSTVHAVGTKRANELGLYDMSGNVWEWCADWYGFYSERQTNPIGPSKGYSRVFRGGSWYNIARCSRVSDRNGTTPTYRGSHLGLRLAL